jgi:hypothetical protein
MSAWAGRGIASLGMAGLWLGLALSLSACAVIEEWQAKPAPAPEPPPPPVVAPPPAPAAAAPVPRLPPSPPPPRPQFDLQSLIGMGEQDIASVLGEPRQVRNDPPAMVWDYQANGCAMSLFFYLDLKSQDFRTLAYNFESGGATDSAKQLCVNRIQESHRDRRR